MLQRLKLPFILISLLAVSAVAGAQSTPADGAAPVVELMPLIIKQEKAFDLTPSQVQALADYRKGAAPLRMKIQQDIVRLRGELRAAILDNQPAEAREALMQRIVEAELAHFKGRDKCVEFVRTILSPEQFLRLRDTYLASLPAVSTK
jgi:hypothetical protein